jgi:hypothetical protein
VSCVHAVVYSKIMPLINASRTHMVQRDTVLEVMFRPAPPSRWLCDLTPRCMVPEARNVGRCRARGGTGMFVSVVGCVAARWARVGLQERCCTTVCIQLHATMVSPFRGSQMARRPRQLTGTWWQAGRSYRLQTSRCGQLLNAADRSLARPAHCRPLGHRPAASTP